MFNTLMNQSMKMMVRGVMKKYLRFPSQQTALLLVDVQGAFLNVDASGAAAITPVAQQNGFKENLAELIALARELDWPIFYAPFDGEEKPEFESPAYKKMRSLVVNDDGIVDDDFSSRVR